MNTHFQYNGEYCRQSDGTNMRLSLRPPLAKLGNELLMDVTKLLTLYCFYIDDTFILVKMKSKRVISLT